MLFRFDGYEPSIHETAYVSETAQVIGDVVIGPQCYIGHGAILRGDYGRIEIGAGTAIEEGVIIHAPPGQVNDIGGRVTVGHGAILHGGHIGDGAVIGMGAVLSLFSEVGQGAIVAEGGIVTAGQKVPPDQVVGGNPAKRLRDVSDKDRMMWDYGKQLYIDLAAKYLDIGMERIDRPSGS